MFKKLVIPSLKGKNYIEYFIDKTLKSENEILRNEVKELKEKYSYIFYEDVKKDFGLKITMYFLIIVIPFLISFLWPLNILISVISFITKKTNSGGIK